MGKKDKRNDFQVKNSKENITRREVGKIEYERKQLGFPERREVEKKILIGKLLIF